jgi:hypothetical protein
MRSVQTPRGLGTLVGLSPDHTQALIMHTRPPGERGPKIGNTYARWWAWNAEKEECYALEELPEVPQEPETKT